MCRGRLPLVAGSALSSTTVVGSTLVSVIRPLPKCPELISDGQGWPSAGAAVITFATSGVPTVYGRTGPLLLPKPGVEVVGRLFSDGRCAVRFALFEKLIIIQSTRRRRIRERFAP